MRNTLATALITATILLATPAHAQPANDACVDAQPIAGLGVFSFDNAGGTTDGVTNTSCNFFASSQIYNDVWFCWTASASGPVAAQTCSQATWDTKLAVYAGCNCPEGGGILACNDDDCGLQSRIEWAAVAGQSYLIRVGAFAQTGFGAGAVEILPNIIPPLAGPFTHPSNGSTYFLLTPSSWTAAEQTAQTLGGHLATVNDADENEFLRSAVLGFDAADRRGWIGLNDASNEGSFAWASGEPSSFSNWSGGEPNNSGGVEDYVEMFGSNGAWNDNSDAPPLLVYGLVEIRGSGCVGDLDGDGSVGLQDLATLLAHFGASGVTPAEGDLDGDTDVDLQDLATLLGAFGTNCP